MNDVYAVWAVEQTGVEVDEKLKRAQACLVRLGVQCREAVVSPDGREMRCRFSAPDAESVRIALRQAGVGGASVTIEGTGRQAGRDPGFASG